MTASNPTLRLEIQFDRVAPQDALDVTSGAAGLPELSASCAAASGHVSCTGGGGGCEGDPQLGDNPEDQVCIDG